MIPAPCSQSELAAILPIIGRLPANSPVRNLAQSHIESSRNTNIEPLLQSLREGIASSNRERQISAWLLGHSVIEPNQRGEALTALLRALKPESVAAIVAPMGCALFLYILFIFALDGISIIIPGITWLCCMMPCVDRVREYAAVSLGYLQCQEAVRPLVQSAFRSEPGVRSGAAFALKSILPTYTQED